MKKFKIVFIATIFMISGFLLGACGMSVAANNDKNSNIESYFLGNAFGESYDTCTIVDKKTGVNYIVLIRGASGDATMCPRYNADGTIYVSK